MINLLPPETKQGYRYASRNVQLLRWVAGMGVAVIAVSIIGGYGWLTLRQQIMESDKANSQTQASLEENNLEQVNKKVTDISSSLKLAENVLSQQIIFSELLKQLAKALPNDSNLKSLTIADVSGGSSLDVTVEAADYQTATQVQVNLADPNNRIFESADIQSITCDAVSSNNQTEGPTYPCTVTLKTQFAEDNPYLFINQGEAS